MTIFEIISLFGVMALLAAIPSTSVALVVTRSATCGIGNGIAVSTGIVLGDLIFILLAVLGLSVVAEAMGGLFAVVKYLGAAYLIWFGIGLLRASSSKRLVDGHELVTDKGENSGSLIASFTAGFALTLGDVKAIFFYIALFPAFIDLGGLQLLDISIIILVTIIAVGGVKVLYAFSAIKIAAMAKGLKLENAAKKTAGCIMVGAGGYLIAKT